MATRNRILFGITTVNHIEIALDEMSGLLELGYTCAQFDYGFRKNRTSIVSRLYIMVLNALKLLCKVYTFKPNFIYFNSRLEYRAGARDFITIALIKLFYFKKITFLIKSHGSDLEVLQSRKFFFRKLVFPFLKKNIKAWLFLSTEEIKWISNNKLLDVDTLFLAKNIVRVNKFQVDKEFNEKLNISSDKNILLFVGRLIKQKGIYDVIEGFYKMKELRNSVLLIVGDGPELNGVKQKIKHLNIEKEVILTGWVDESIVTDYTSNSDILVFPTYFPEGFPMALFNSQAAGLALITTPLRASLDYLQESRNCIWVEPKSPIAITSAINQLLDNPDLMKKMRINNKNDAKRFTRSSVSKDLDNILKELK